MGGSRFKGQVGMMYDMEKAFSVWVSRGPHKIHMALVFPHLIYAAL